MFRVSLPRQFTSIYLFEIYPRHIRDGCTSVSVLHFVQLSIHSCCYIRVHEKKKSTSIFLNPTFPFQLSRNTTAIHRYIISPEGKQAVVFSRDPVASPLCLRLFPPKKVEPAPVDFVKIINISRFSSALFLSLSPSLRRSPTRSWRSKHGPC